ncbi:hypothetical protein [Clostridium sp. CCUG 7971]|uniref:hypothetical protein n=1 Tax=Clostridium sp. CCUG 7971 TaxID=2811414 RepID=UPI001ABAABB5|nr:hypothetical protein [Clostridium sp. CCUG 7971]MBO3445701.1 hypothetical protein [Clostridium sp. CCUG 7971]
MQKLKKGFISILLIILFISVTACSDSRDKISFESEIFSEDSPKIGDLEKSVEDYWSKSYNCSSAKDYISIEHRNKFNSKYQEDTRVFYDIGFINGKNRCSSVSIDLMKFEAYKDKYMKEVVDMAKLFIDHNIDFNEQEESLELVVEDLGKRSVIYRLYLKSDKVINDKEYGGNLNGGNNPYEEIRIIKTNKSLEMKVGSIKEFNKSSDLRDKTIIKLNPDLINNEVVINEILNIEDINDINTRYLGSNPK